MHKQLATSLGRLHRAEGRLRGGPALRWYRALEAQVRELQRLLGKKAMENELLREVRVAFALDCCDREAMGHVATTGGVTACIRTALWAIVHPREYIVQTREAPSGP